MGPVLTIICALGVVVNLYMELYFIALLLAVSVVLRVLTLPTIKGEEKP